MAVLHAIDLSFNGGKGKILQEYTKALEGVGKKTPYKPKDGVRVNKAFMDFMSKLPKREAVNEPT